LRLSDATHSGKAVERVGKSRGKRLLLASLPFPTVSPSWQGLLLALRQDMPRESRALRMKKTFSHAVCVPFLSGFFVQKTNPSTGRTLKSTVGVEPTITPHESRSAYALEAPRAPSCSDRYTYRSRLHTQNNRFWHVYHGKKAAKTKNALQKVRFL